MCLPSVLHQERASLKDQMGYRSSLQDLEHKQIGIDDWVGLRLEPASCTGYESKASANGILCLDGIKLEY